MQNSSQSIYLSKKERIGLITLVALLSLGIILPIIISKVNKDVKISKSIVADNHYKKDSIPEIKTSIKKRTFQSKTNISKSNLTKPKVNPNEMTLEQAIEIGMPEKNYKTLQKYLSTGARIKTVNDLKKIYGVKESTFKKISSHIYIPGKDSVQSIKNENQREYLITLQKDILIEINTAGIEEFKSLPGIGEKLAERIIKFRTGLGGFLNVSQLKEVYGIHDTTFNKFSHQLICNSKIIKIKINSSDKDELTVHPYISYRQAEFIIHYRRQNGNIKNLEDLNQTNFFTAEWLKKIKDYLDFQQ